MGDGFIQVTATFIVAMFLIFIIWAIRKGIKKISKNWAFKIKYGILKRKYNEDDVLFLMEKYENNVSNDDVYKAIISDPKKPRSLKQAEEMIFIYNKMKKGGENNGER